MRLERRIDQHGLAALRLYHVSGVEAAQRRPDVARRLLAYRALYYLHRLARRRRQRWTREFPAQAALAHIPLQELRLVRLRRGIEPVQIDDQAAAVLCRRSSSFAWIPPKPPLDMMRTLSPGRASATTARTNASMSSKHRARLPSRANTPAASQPSPALSTYTRSATARLPGSASFITPR